MPNEKSSRKRLFKSKPHVSFLDIGMIAELSKSDQVNLVKFFEAIARRDGRTTAECTLRLSKRQNYPNPKAFIEEVDEAFTFWGSPEGDLIHPAEYMQQLLEKVRCHKVNVDDNVCTMLVTTLVLEVLVVFMEKDEIKKPIICALFGQLLNGGSLDRLILVLQSKMNHFARKALDGFPFKVETFEVETMHEVEHFGSILTIFKSNVSCSLASG